MVPGAVDLADDIQVLETMPVEIQTPELVVVKDDTTLFNEFG